MRQYPVRRPAGDREPAFELPPRLGGRVERRLAGRATASWLELGGGLGLPAASRLDLDADNEFTPYSLLLDLRGDEQVPVISAGTAVAAQFGIAAGTPLLASQGDLAARLLDACALLRLTQATVPVEGSFAGMQRNMLLTRGVLMPLACEDGRLGFAHGVITWKEVLGAAASTALRHEFATALAERRSH